MSEPWFDPYTFGAWCGATCGTLCGVLGAAAGCLAPLGKCRTLILGSIVVVAVIGVVQIILGVTALVLGQPFGIWFFLLLCGSTMASGIGGLKHGARIYDRAEQRRIEAEAIRRA